MTLLMQKPTGAKLLLQKPTGGKLNITPTAALVDDPDAMSYLAAVEAADGQALESATRLAVNAFIKGCKADGIWPAIKASCILSGARTLAGALVPLVGSAPTNFNFVSGDYNRKTGLAGDGATKYLNSNRASNADPRNNVHLSVCLSSPGATNANRSHMATGLTNNDLSEIIALSDGRLVIRNRNANADTNIVSNPAGGGAGFMGSSRSVGTQYTMRWSGSSRTITSAAEAVSNDPSSQSYFLFARNAGPAVFSDARIAFYSIGESLDLALLDTRVTALVNAFAAAIP